MNTRPLRAKIPHYHAPISCELVIDTRVMDGEVKDFIQSWVKNHIPFEPYCEN